MTIDEAFQAVPRGAFLPRSVREFADIDRALPIGYSQTNSQPSTVRAMLGWLNVHPGDTVLDIGSGSGWTSALLAMLTGPAGMVYAVEKIPELVRFGRSNCAKFDVKNVRFFRARSVVGLPTYAPYDRILVSAAARELPAGLLPQLATHGKMVIPVNQDIVEITKTSDDAYDTVRHSGYIFVPLVD